ncbi:hypothetical protein K461DRAFT_272144 [Myriangium duriaei CBS 260.36]|uniref:Uncharacterized protein n=1 Tax=Myriangium duriaei CBS 260.36 TaxID=1168546 RepID=A0A9P4IPY5_9PEZI|nr:hypothetical protein K461DRAFT_272144 [Myriangium duriaei CBS 260.36]
MAQRAKEYLEEMAGPRPIEPDCPYPTEEAIFNAKSRDELWKYHRDIDEWQMHWSSLYHWLEEVQADTIKEQVMERLEASNVLLLILEARDEDLKREEERMETETNGDGGLEEGEVS